MFFWLSKSDQVQIETVKRGVVVYFHCAQEFHLLICTHLGESNEFKNKIQTHLKNAISPTDTVKLIGELKCVETAGIWLKELGFQIDKKIEKQYPFEILYESNIGKLKVSKEPPPSLNTESSVQPKGPIFTSATRVARPEAMKPSGAIAANTSATSCEKKIRVLVIDDSKTIRQLMQGLLSTAPDLEIVDLIESPLKALEVIKQGGIDVITLDIHMPEMDGVTLLKTYIQAHPIPTLIISSVSMEEGPTVLTALEAGAVDYVQKPSLREMQLIGPVILDKIRAASQANIKVKNTKPVTRARASKFNSDSLVAIGSSTGGTEALKRIFEGLPDQIPPTVVVQHIPAVFSKAFADRLNQLMPFDVKEAEDGDEVRDNLVLIAPGGKQMKVVESGTGKLKVQINDDAPVNRHKPSVDYLFFSIAKLNLPHTIGIVLTGMGADGAKGLLSLKSAGAATIAQDEKTSVVYGMPKEAALTGAVDSILPLDEIAGALMNLAGSKKSKAS